MNSFRFDLAKAKLRAAEIAANAKLGRMPSPVDVVMMCELIRDLSNMCEKQDDAIKEVGDSLQSLVSEVVGVVN